LYHISSEPINKYDLLKLINEAYDADIEIEPFDDFRIDRSLDSSKIRKLTGFQPASWEEMIGEMANDPTPYEKWRT
jgi:dTDP-4-dehydrorhamnose reductase